MPNHTNHEIDRLHKIVKGLYSKGASEIDIIMKLKEEGVEENYAKIIIHNVISDQEKNKGFWKLLSLGILTIIGGILINYYSYIVATNSGSLFFYLFWGIIVSGVLMIVRAFILFRK